MTTRRERSRSSRRDQDACVEIYLEGDLEGVDTPFRARRDICIRRSGWMEAALSFKAKQGQGASVRLDGLDQATSIALVRYLQLNSASLLTLPKEDLRDLMDIFELHEFKQQHLDAAKRQADEQSIRTCAYCKVTYREKDNHSSACRRRTLGTNGLCVRCRCAVSFCKCPSIDCRHSAEDCGGQ